MAGNPDVLIVGGGVIGLTAAYLLAREGIKVVVADKGEMGRESSWAGAGILCPAIAHRAATAAELLRAQSFSHFPQLSAELRDCTGIDNGFAICGGLEFHVGAQEGEDEWHGHGVTVESLTASEAHAIEPALAADYGPALHIPEMAQVRNPRHIQALYAAGTILGVQFLPHCPVVEWQVQNGRVTAAFTADQMLHFDQLIICGGAWSSMLLKPLGCRIPIRPIRGQIVLLNTGTRILQRIIVSGPRYLVPRADGRLLIGSTEEDVGFCNRTTAAAVRDLIAFGTRLVPALAEAPVERCWAGLRPGSPDGIPFIGPLPGLENAFVAAGHFRAGIQLSPGTGIMLKELVRRQAQTISTDAFRPNRLANSSVMTAFRPAQ